MCEIPIIGAVVDELLPTLPFEHNTIIVKTIGSILTFGEYVDEIADKIIVGVEAANTGK